MAGSAQHVKEQLVTVLKEGDTSKVASLLRNHDGLTSSQDPQLWLHLAVSAPLNSRRMLRLLLQKGMSPDTPDPTGATALHLAVKKGRVACLQELLRWKANVNSTDNLGHSPLHYGAKSNRTGVISCMNLLLQAGAFADASAKNGFTPLHVAAEVNNVEAAKILLSAGAASSLTEVRGRTPLHLTTTAVLAEILLAAGGEVTCEDSSGQTPLDLAIKHYPALAPTLLGAGIAVEGEVQDSDLRVLLDLNMIRGKREGEVGLLNTMVRFGHYDLLKHPLCETFLHLKWLLVYPLFYIKWFIFLSVVIFLTTDLCLRLNLPLPEDCNNTTVIETSGESSDCDTLVVVVVLNFVALVMVAVLVVRAVIQILILRSVYWRRTEKWVELLFAMCSVVLLVMHGRLQDWERHVGALTLLLGWYEVTVMVGHIPSVGIYVQMFHAVAKRLMKFTAVYSALFFGFAVSFHLVFKGEETFQTVWSSTLKTLAMMVGELDFGDILGGDTPNALPGTSYLVFVLFVLMMTVVTTNLLVGLAVQDIQKLVKVAGVQRLALTVEQEVSVDLMLSSRLLGFLLPRRLLEWLKRRLSLLQQFPATRLGTNHANAIHTLVTCARSCASQWWVSTETVNIHQGKMDQYNVILCPYNPSDPHVVYSNISTKQKLIPTGHKIPSWLVRNLRLLLESGLHRPHCNKLVKDYTDDEYGSSGSEEEQHLDDDKSLTSVGNGDRDSCQGDSHVQNGDVVNDDDSSHSAYSLTLSHMQEQLNDLKASITELSQLLRETKC